MLIRRAASDRSILPKAAIAYAVADAVGLSGWVLVAHYVLPPPWALLASGALSIAAVSHTGWTLFRAERSSRAH